MNNPVKVIHNAALPKTAARPLRVPALSLKRACASAHGWFWVLFSLISVVLSQAATPQPGALDLSFDPTASLVLSSRFNQSVLSIAVQTDKKIRVGGGLTSLGG